MADGIRSGTDVHRIRALGGYELEAPTGDHIGKHLSRGKPYEPWVLRIASALTPTGGTFVDVGAHIGNHTVYMARSGAEVVAVEPHPETFRLLRANIARNGVAGSVRAINVACGADHSRGTATVPNKSNTGSATVTVGEGPIKVVTVDSLGAEADVLKIDVEGSEGAVLTGAVETLRSFRPAIICERHSGDLDVILRPLGYRRIGGSFAASPTYLYVARRGHLVAALLWVAAHRMHSLARWAATRALRPLLRARLRTRSRGAGGEGVLA